MTINQVKHIIELRTQNYSYASIGKAMGISHNTVKSVCRRRNITPSGRRKSKEEKARITVCKNCGKPIFATTNHRRKFCAEKCRYDYWNRVRKYEDGIYEGSKRP